MRYGEIPKSCTMDARHNNIEHQVNANQSLNLIGVKHIFSDLIFCNVESQLIFFSFMQRSKGSRPPYPHLRVQLMSVKDSTRLTGSRLQGTTLP